MVVAGFFPIQMPIPPHFPHPLTSIGARLENLIKLYVNTLEVAGKHRYKVYIASPGFTEGEKAFLKRIYNFLNKHFTYVFEPFNDNRIKEILENPDYTDIIKGKAIDIFKVNIEELDKCDIVVAILDNDDPGVIFEIAYAFSKRKPILGIITDTRPKLYNVMISAGVNSIILAYNEKIILKTIEDILLHGKYSRGSPLDGAKELTEKIYQTSY